MGERGRKLQYFLEDFSTIVVVLTSGAIGCLSESFNECFCRARFLMLNEIGLWRSTMEEWEAVV